MIPRHCIVRCIYGNIFTKGLSNRATRYTSTNSSDNCDCNLCRNFLGWQKNTNYTKN